MLKNPENLKLVILTSNGKRHKFFANFLIERFNVVGIVTEKKRPLAATAAVEEESTVMEHKKRIKESEEKYFGQYEKFNLPEENILALDFGQINSELAFKWIADRQPDYIILYGTDIIRPPLLSHFENKIINMHLGLSPYYRGSATNFWALAEGEPEGVGATIHLAVQKVDAGSILAQVRPEISPGDDDQDIGNKTIIAGTKLMAECIVRYAEGRLVPQPQNLTIGKIFKKKDFNAQAVLKMRENFARGMIKNFLDHKAARLAKYPIVEIR